MGHRGRLQQELEGKIVGNTHVVVAAAAAVVVVPSTVAAAVVVVPSNAAAAAATELAAVAVELDIARRVSVASVCAVDVAMQVQEERTEEQK